MILDTKQTAEQELADIAKLARLLEVDVRRLERDVDVAPFNFADMGADEFCCGSHEIGEFFLYDGEWQLQDEADARDTMDDKNVTEDELLALFARKAQRLTRPLYHATTIPAQSLAEKALRICGFVPVAREQNENLVTFWVATRSSIRKRFEEARKL